MMGPKKDFAVSMDGLYMAQCLEKVLIQFFLPQCIYLQKNTTSKYNRILPTL